MNVLEKKSGSVWSLESGKGLIFLIGLPRSGTTLLQRILGGHSAIHTLPEPWIMLSPLYAMKMGGIAAEYDARMARNALASYLSAVEGGGEVFYEAVRAYSEVLYGKAMIGRSEVFFMDKTPRYYLILNELSATFPAARFVFIYRNPLAILSSVLTTWFKNDVATFLQQQYVYNDLIKGPAMLLEGQQKLGGRVVNVSYEALVNDPENAIKKLSSRLGIVWEPDTIEYGNKSFVQGRFGDPVGVHQHTRPQTASLKRWESNFSEAERNLFAKKYLATLGEGVISALGYDIEVLQRKLEG